MNEPNRLELACAGAGWVESPAFRCLGFDWRLRSNDDALVRDVTGLYGACSSSAPAHHRLMLRRRTTTPPEVTVYRDGRAVRRHVGPGLAVAHVVWEVNRGVLEDATDRLLLHAAAAEHDGTVVVLAGPPDAGKSTLVAGLVRAGLRYVTDETVSVDVPSLTIEPYPKPIALERGSWSALRDLRPVAESSGDQWLVPPLSIRADAVAPAGGVARVVVLPAYRPDQPTSLQEISRAEALVAVAEQTFNFRALGAGALDVVAGVVRECRCYRLEVGDLETACRLVLGILESTSATRSAAL